MTPSRQTETPKPKLNIWIPVKPKDHYRADVEKLKAAIAASPNTDEVIRKQMGRGYANLERALNGEVITVWNVQNIEHGLSEPATFKGMAPANPALAPPGHDRPNVKGL